MGLKRLFPLVLLTLSLASPVWAQTAQQSSGYPTRSTTENLAAKRYVVTGDRAFFEKVIALLKDRHTYHATLWSYALMHDVVPALGQELTWLLFQFTAEPLVMLLPLEIDTGVVPSREMVNP